MTSVESVLRLLMEFPAVRGLVALNERTGCMLQLIVALLWLASCGHLGELASHSAFSGEANVRGPLDDRMHELIGYCDQAGQSTTLGTCPPFWSMITNMLPDKCVFASKLMTFAMFGGAAWRQGDFRVFPKLMTQLALLWSFLLILRSAVVASTIMPAPSPLCRNVTSWDERPPRFHGWFLTSVDCNDAMFSGHADDYGLFCIFWMLSYMPRTVKVAWFCWYIICCVSSFAVRDHYTSDVLVATYISVSIGLHRASTIRGLLNGLPKTSQHQLEKQLGGGLEEKLLNTNDIVDSNISKADSQC